MRAKPQAVQESIEEYTIEASILKVFGTETLDFVADEALQVLGGYGFTAEYPVERHYRDSCIDRIRASRGDGGSACHVCH